MSQHPIIVFVCEHGAAKSIMAAAYFNELAVQRRLEVRAVARGTNPDPELSTATIRGLSKDGLSPTESIPQKLSLEDVEGAQQIVSFCEVPTEYVGKVTIEQWQEIPPVSEDYVKARDAILERLTQFLDHIRSSP